MQPADESRNVATLTGLSRYAQALVGVVCARTFHPKEPLLRCPCVLEVMVNVEIVLLIAIGLLLLGVLPLYPYSSTWGYAPSALVAAIFVIVLILEFV